MNKLYTNVNIFTKQSDLKKVSSKLAFSSCISNIMKKNYTILLLACLLFLGGNVFGQAPYKLITSTSDLVVGEKYLIGSAQTTSTQLMGLPNANNRGQSNTGSYAITSGIISITAATTTADATKAYEITLGGSSGAWILYDSVSAGFLRAGSSSSNYLQTTGTTANWTITFSSNAAVMTCTTGSYTRNILRYNSGNVPPIFSCYATGQSAVYLYRKAYSVTYLGNSNTGGTAPTDASSPYFSGATVTVKANTGTLVRTGYTFSG